MKLNIPQRIDEEKALIVKCLKSEAALRSLLRRLQALRREREDILRKLRTIQETTL